MTKAIVTIATGVSARLYNRYRNFIIGDNNDIRQELWIWSEKKRKKIRGKKESDWRDYYGSSPNLTKDIEKLGKDKFTREILHYCTSKALTSYIEAKEQFERKVLESDDYYNGHIQVRVHGSHIKGKL